MYKVDIKNIGNSEIEITGEIAGDTFESHRKEAVKKISEKIIQNIIIEQDNLHLKILKNSIACKKKKK